MTEQSTGDAVPEGWNAVGPESDMWMDPAQDPRFAAGAELEGERATLSDYLRAYRLALEMKCADLDAGQLARPRRSAPRADRRPRRPVMVGQGHDLAHSP